MLEPSLDLYGATYDSVDGILRELLAKSRARYALIIDRQGFVLMHSRALWAPKPPSLDSFATLVASNYAANRAIANLFGEDGFKETVYLYRLLRNKWCIVRLFLWDIRLYFEGRKSGN